MTAPKSCCIIIVPRVWNIDVSRIVRYYINEYNIMYCKVYARRDDGYKFV